MSHPSGPTSRSTTSAPRDRTLHDAAWDYIADMPRPRRLSHAFEAAADRSPESIALECHGDVLTYAELDARANRLARHLVGLGAGPGVGIGILLERSTPMYVAVLAILKSGSHYVPIDPAAPADRVEYIASDASLSLLVTSRAKAPSSAGTQERPVFVDEVEPALTSTDASRVQLDTAEDTLAYIIYTSGSTGRPKGVAITHSSICNFVTVASQVYGIRPDDRVYQGLSISFDFSLEEFWTTWNTGATLVAGPTDGRKIGSGLARFLEENRISVLHAVPTVLSTLDRVLPDIRLLNLGGEAVPQELVERWGSPTCRILNTYGPTECTASCTWTELFAGVPVTIGKALPSYTASLRDPEDFAIVPYGAVGELCISGVGVAVGYVGRPDLTADKFVLDEHGVRTYKTGDLGRYDDEGNIVYLGRKDAEVKVRGHRVDLGEIEGVLLEGSEVNGAVVRLLDTPGTGGELAAYVLPTSPAFNTREQALALHDHARRRLPAYMVPDYIEFIETIPLMPSGKADRNALPAPLHPRLIGSSVAFRGATTPTERALVELWGRLLRVPAEQLSVDADLFTDLGGHSLVAATLVSEMRGSGLPGTPAMSIPDLYEHPSIAALSRFLDAEGDADEPADDGPRRVRYPAGRIWAFGLAQLLFLYVVVTLSLLPLGLIYWWNQGQPSTELLLELMLSTPVSYLCFRWIIPLAVARGVGLGLREGDYPLYGSVHLRTWMVQRAMSLSPLAHLAGSHLMPRYLRLLGAHVGEGTNIASGLISVPSLVELGDDASVGYECHLRPSEIVDGRLRLGRIVLGDRATADANTVIVGPSSIGDRGILRAQSSLLAGTHLPAGEVWSGSPAAPTSSNDDPIIALMTDCDDAPREWNADLRRKFGLGIAFLEMLPLLASVPAMVLVWWVLLRYDHVAALAATLAAGPLFVAATCGLILWSRRFALLKTPIGVHHLRSELGLEKWFGDKLLEASLELTNSLYGTLYTPAWLRMLGAHIGKGSEIATISHIDPDLLELRDGTFVADMAAIGSATFMNGHVAFRRTIVDERAFVGNASYVPSGTFLGQDTLVGVLSKPPTGGARPGTSWLGNPPIFLPQREVYDEFGDETTFHPPRWKVVVRLIIEFFRMTLPATILGLSVYYTLFVLAALAPTWSPVPLVLVTGAVALSGSVLVTVVVALMKWIIVGRYRPRVEPLWGQFVRRTEFMTGIFETTAVPALLALVQGTPFLAPCLRLFGVKIGRRCLLDTTYITEFDLVRIGDDVTVGPAVSLQTHLFEDRVMKMGTVDLMSGCTIGSRSVVLYGATVGEDASLAPLTLCMKGESLPAGTQWAGIPARRHRAHAALSAITQQEGPQ